ncbi:MAG TPA: LysM peptidoglycan-binding domain-containing protein [Proteobacteria bacterium]|nr:LysM peptidoglycan-binding domain-containing protein [Pseudomonadota bacterium]
MKFAIRKSMKAISKEPFPIIRRWRGKLSLMGWWVLSLCLFGVGCNGRLGGEGTLCRPITLSEAVENAAPEFPVVEWQESLDGDIGEGSALTVFLEYLDEMGSFSVGDPSDSVADIELELQARTVARYQFPLVMNARVQHFISYYSTVQNRFMHRSLARSHRYLGMMRKVLREHDIPEELAYMVLIESGFTNHAYSSAQACGPWQFISATGKRYGLKINAWVDERRDPVKATYAAAAYLVDLYTMFDSWYLAAAAYNAGEGKIQRAMRRHQTDDFWEMARFNYLKRETKDYIPRLIAAIMIAREPEKYGFVEIEYEDPFAFDLVRLEDATDLKVIAWAAGVPVEELRKLNPELSYWCTPPGAGNYELRVPEGSGQVCQQVLSGLSPEKRITFRKHLIAPGDTLSTIARRYRTGVSQIKELNGLAGTRIRAGRELLIPVRVAGSGPVVFDQAIYRSGSPAALPPVPSGSGGQTAYRVRTGDSLWKIARRYNLSVAELQLFNDLGQSTTIKPGQVLRLRPAAANRIKPKPVPVVKGKKERQEIVTLNRGDNLWRIARRYQVTVSELESWNRLPPGKILQPGQQLVVYR